MDQIGTQDGQGQNGVVTTQSSFASHNSHSRMEPNYKPLLMACALPRLTPEMAA
jgi:hypothetical protein